MQEGKVIIIPLSFGSKCGWLASFTLRQL